MPMRPWEQRIRTAYARVRSNESVIAYLAEDCTDVRHEGRFVFRLDRRREQKRGHQDKVSKRLITVFVWQQLFSAILHQRRRETTDCATASWRRRWCCPN